MHATHTRETITVIRSRLRSAIEDPPNAVDMPPPKRSDIPPPRLLWTKIAKVSNAEAMMRTIDKTRIGVVISRGVRKLTRTY